MKPIGLIPDLCFLGTLFLAIGMAGQNLWEWTPTVGWFLAIFFFSSAFFAALKNHYKK